MVNELRLHKTRLKRLGPQAPLSQAGIPAVGKLRSVIK
jgi:hypothetical protein